MSEVGSECGGLKKKPLDIIDHMTEHLQSYEGRYLVLGPPGGASPGWSSGGGVYYPQPPYLVMNQPQQGFIYQGGASPTHHPLIHPTYYTHRGYGGGESGGCLIENMVGNWSPDLSGTYSPFGGGSAASGSAGLSQPATNLGPTEEDRRSQPQPQPKKQRIVAEVKPLRPSYSDVLAKSPPPSSPATKQPPPAKQQPATKPAEPRHRQAKSASPASTPPAQHRADAKRESSNEETELKKPKKAETSENRPPDLQPQSKKHKKAKQTNKQNSKEEKSRGGGGKNWKQAGYQGDVYKKYPAGSGSGEEESEPEVEPSPASHRPRAQPDPLRKQTGGNKGAERGSVPLRPAAKSKRSLRASKRKDNKLGLLWKKWQEKSSHYLMLMASWLINLLVDVTAMSAALLLQMGGMVWKGGVEVCWSSWTWVKRRCTRESPPLLHPPQGVTSLQHNIQLPTTGEEAMKRLLSCKGKDPYSILGLTSSCTDEEIRRYYRSQALLVHPDKNSQPGAEEAFKILVHAFDLIAEPEKRAAYDRYVAETNQVEQAWSELSELLTQLHEKMHYAATTIRCNKCGKRHKRVLTERPVYAARFCAQCNIHHSAKEGDMWCEWGRWLWSRRYLACMEGSVYEITEWAKCQGGGLTDLAPHSHLVHYRVLLGGVQGGVSTQPEHPPAGEADFDDLLSSLYGGGGARHRMPPSRHSKKKKAK